MIFGIILERHRFFLKTENIFTSSLLPCDTAWDHPCKKIIAGNNTVIITVARGASVAVCAFHKLVTEFNVDYVLRIGTAGGLCGTLSIGDCMLSSAAIRDEGTSRFYLDDNIPAISPFFETLSLYQHLTKNITTHVGLSLTTDGRWKETVSALEAYQHIGALTVDMETAALLAAGMETNVPVLSLSIVTDFPVFDKGDYIGIIQTDQWQTQIFPRFEQVLTSCLEWMSNKLNKED